MERSEIINKIKNAAVNVMKENKIIASLLIAEAICILESEYYYGKIQKLLDVNNPFAIKAQYQKQKKHAYYDSYEQIHYRKFNTMEEGIAKYISINYKRFSTLKSIYDYNEVLAKDSTLTEEKANQLKLIIEGYRLNELDNKYVDSIYESKKHIVEIPLENDSTKYYQEQSNYDKPNTQITPNYAKTTSFKKTVEPSKKVYYKGDEIVLCNANLYESPSSGIPIRLISGTYYIASSTPILNRYAIAFKKEFIIDNNMILGYVNKNDLK